MNKKVLMLITMLLAVAMLATPVMAETAQKIPVTANVYGQVDVSTGKSWYSPNGVIRIIQGLERTGNVRLTIDGEDPLEGTFWSVENCEVNHNTGVYLAHANPMVWTFETEQGTGSFEGVKQLRWTFDPVTKIALRVEQHGVFQGSGVFEGCTLKFSMDWVQGDSLPRLFTGYLLIH